MKFRRVSQWNNLHELKRNYKLHNIMFKIIYQIYQANKALYNKGIIDRNMCIECQSIDSLE